ncbi:hypothetical protein DWX43_19135 [Clostridium sp. AF19-22AC]|jgi:prophage antirepressor-like protein|uniref:hypothetical protein n=1 Tax=Clostridia TaxID=186801 RepID=UPI000E4732F9|nr:MULTISPECIES: hypothetical protein [Clostridia]RHR24757.1 hypothetical protein DWX43_19135 [Clostridium sp. AF19-22AC]DAQ34311.1 MAG TPA: antirepressor [Caudoviricetes sp.]
MKNEIKVFENQELGIKVRIIENEDESISINAEDTAIGFGWTQTQNKGGKQYTSVRWETLNGYCSDLGFPNKLGKGDYIPEPLFYRLGMKASNATADAYQNWLAFDVIPSIRKTGFYEMPKMDSPKREKLSSANMMAKNIKDTLMAAGVEPIYIAAEVSRIYTDLGFPVNAHLPVAAPILWDCTGMAKQLGVMSKGGRPHDKAISAIIQKLDISEDEIVRTAYSRNGHDGVTVQYTDSVFQKVKKWLEDHNYPPEITLLLANGNINTCKVIYQEVC